MQLKINSRTLVSGGVLLASVLMLTSCANVSPLEKSNKSILDELLQLGCEAWKKKPIDTQELSSKFASAANTYNELHKDKKYDPLALAAINWNLIEVNDRTPADELLVKNLAGFTIIEFCKSGKIVDYANP